MSSKHMQPCAQLLADFKAINSPTQAGGAAAVFCQEPAVVQLTERVEQLPEFRSSGLAVAGHDGGEVQQGPVKVLRGGCVWCEVHAGDWP